MVEPKVMDTDMYDAMVSIHPDMADLIKGMLAFLILFEGLCSAPAHLKGSRDQETKGQKYPLIIGSK